MSQSFEPTTVFSTLFMNPIGGKTSANPDPELPVPELRHAEAVLRRMLRGRGQGNPTELLTERVRQAAAVISNGLLRTESMVLSGSSADGRNRTHSASVGPESGIGEIQCASRRRHIASRLAKRVVQSMTRSSAR